MTNVRCWTNRSVTYLVGFALQSTLSLGAPHRASAQTRFDVTPDVSAPGGQANPQTQGGGPSKSWPRRHPVLIATMIGAAAGGVAGCKLGSSGGNPDVSCEFYVAPFAFLGAGIGLAVGWAASPHTGPIPLSPNNVQRYVKHGQKVVVDKNGRDQTIGKVAEVSGDAITIAYNDGTTKTFGNVALTAQVKPDSLKNGLLIGAAPGALIAAAAYKDGAGAAGMLAIPLWALIGAGVDKLIRHDELIMGDQGGGSSPSIAVLPSLGRRSGGVALSVKF
jgi:hypothetical protein